MKVAVTGATGFIGRHLVKELDSRGHHVCRIGRDWEFPEGCDVVFHLAAVYKKDPLPSEMMDMFEANVALTNKALTYCKDTGAKLIFATSYFAENPTMLYALQKRHAEETIGLFGKLYGTRSTIVKLYNTWGLCDTRSLLLSKIVRGEPVELTDENGEVRFTHVTTVARFLAGLIHSDESVVTVPYETLTAKELRNCDWKGRT